MKRKCDVENLLDGDFGRLLYDYDSKKIVFLPITDEDMLNFFYRRNPTPEHYWKKACRYTIGNERYYQAVIEKKNFRLIWRERSPDKLPKGYGLSPDGSGKIIYEKLRVIKEVWEQLDPGSKKTMKIGKDLGLLSFDEKLKKIGFTPIKEEDKPMLCFYYACPDSKTRRRNAYLCSDGCYQAVIEKKDFEKTSMRMDFWSPTTKHNGYIRKDERIIINPSIACKVEWERLYLEQTQTRDENTPSNQSVQSQTQTQFQTQDTQEQVFENSAYNTVATTLGLFATINDLNTTKFETQPGTPPDIPTKVIVPDSTSSALDLNDVIKQTDEEIYGDDEAAEFYKIN